MSAYKHLAAAAVLAAGTATQAANVSLSTGYVGAGANVYFATLSTAVDQDFTPSNGTDNITAGLILASGASGSFFAYGIEPAAPRTQASTVYDSGNYVATLDVQRLYSGYYDRVVNPATGLAVRGDNIDEVAFQIALWELVNDDGNLAGGDLSFAGVIDPATLPYVARAQFFLSNLPSTVTTAYNFTRYSAPNTTGTGGALTGTQDLLLATPATATAVPEPGTTALVIGALAALGAVGRRAQPRRVS